MPFVLLTTFLMPFSILASWESITKRVAEYMIAFLVLETLMIGVFCALDLVLFYLFFEGGLIPMFLIIGIWGGKRRVYASFKFFLYTLVGSLLMLIAILAMYNQAGTTDIQTLLNTHFSPQMQTWLWLAFFASFAVKMPMWPVHTWLPDAHVEAPTAGSVILAAILLKMGGYGFIRFSLPMFPDASVQFAPLVYALSVIAIVYTSLVALVQEDIKKLIAYSSVAHMGFVTMGLFTLNTQGVQGAMFLMISHGFVSGALFLCVGVIYDRMHTREISAYGGLVKRMPLYAFIFMVFTLANVGLPGTSGFVGEFLTLVGAFNANSWVALFATIGRHPLGGLCAVSLSPRDLRGSRQGEPRQTSRICRRAKSRSSLRLLALTIYYGVWPGPVLEASAASVANLLNSHSALLRRGSHSPPPANDGSVKMPFFTQLAHHFLPEVILAVGVLALILVGAWRGERSFSLVTELTVAVLGLAILAILLSTKSEAIVFDGAYIDDAFSRFVKVLTLRRVAGDDPAVVGFSAPRRAR